MARPVRLPKHLAFLVVVGTLTFVALSGQGPVPSAIDPCAGARDLRMTNGRFVTMDRRNSIVSEVTIQDGRFVSVGSVGNRRLTHARARSICEDEPSFRD
jgi:hypothetical protein